MLVAMGRVKYAANPAPQQQTPNGRAPLVGRSPMAYIHPNGVRNRTSPRPGYSPSPEPPPAPQQQVHDQPPEAWSDGLTDYPLTQPPASAPSLNAGLTRAQTMANPGTPMANHDTPSEMPNFNSPASFSSLRPPSNPAVDTTSATAPALQRLFQPASAARMPRAGDARPAWMQQAPPPRNPMAVRPPAAAPALPLRQTPQPRPQQQTVSAFNQLPQDFQQRFSARQQSGQNAPHMDQQYAVNYYNQHYVNSEKPQQPVQSPRTPASPPAPMAPQPRYGEGSQDDIRNSVVQNKLQSNPGMSPEDQAAFQYAGHVDRMSTNEARRQQTTGDYGRGRGVDNIGRSPAQWGRLAAADAARAAKPTASTGGNVILDTNPSRPRPSTEELASRRQAHLGREQAIKDTRRNSRQQRRLMFASR